MLLMAAGWHVCDASAANIHAARGVAIREFPLALYQASNTVQFSLQSFNIGLAAVGNAAHFDIKATMRR